MNMGLYEVAMCEKCRSNHFQSEEGRGGGVKKFEDWVTLAGGYRKATPDCNGLSDLKVHSRIWYNFWHLKAL